MVMMNTEEYNQLMPELEVLEKLQDGEHAIDRGETVDAYEGLEQIRRRYGLEY